MYSVPALIVIVIWLAAFVVVVAVKRTPEALAGGMVFGMLFLPQFIIDLPFLDLDKSVLLAGVTAVGAVLVDPLLRPVFRPSFLDLPVVLLSLAGLAASLSNGLGLYDGLVSATHLFFTWGIPYFIGRLVFSSSENALTLLRTVIFGALVYVPFVAFEMKMAPILHSTIYGYQPRGSNDFVHAVRFGFWRPTVFMKMGLQLSLFMGISSVVAFWGAVSTRIPKISRLPTKLVAWMLAATTVLCMSSAAVLLMAAGWSVVLSGRLKLQRYLLLTLLLVAAGYPIYRMTNVGAIRIETTTDENLELVERKASLMTRIENEDFFLGKWSTKPILGWTPWYFRDVDKVLVISDSLWIIILSCYGLAGWLAWSLMLGLPGLITIVNAKTSVSVAHPMLPLALCVLLFWLDSLLNAFPTVLYGVMIGAAVGLRGILGELTPSSAKIDQSCSGELIVKRSLWPPASLPLYDPESK